MTNKRLKRVTIVPEILFHMLSNGTAWKVEYGLPTGSELRGMSYDPITQTLNLFVEHESFDVIDVTRDVAPQFTPLMKKL